MDYTRMEEDLIRDEGLKLRTYRCTAGVLTVGVGHAVRPEDRIAEGDMISLERAGRMLASDISASIRDATSVFGRAVFDSWPDARQRAVVNMLFNLGKSRFLTFRNTIQAMLDGRWSDAAKGVRSSKYYKQVGKRAERIATALERGK
mgnify:CR=1 FL=1